MIPIGTRVRFTDSSHIDREFRGVSGTVIPCPQALLAYRTWVELDEPLPNGRTGFNGTKKFHIDDQYVEVISPSLSDVLEFSR